MFGLGILLELALDATFFNAVWTFAVYCNGPFAEVLIGSWIFCLEFSAELQIACWDIAGCWPPHASLALYVAVCLSSGKASNASTNILAKQMHNTAAAKAATYQHGA
ncbi:hypothetical protein Nepgr_016357 [Nepenthes gracilis]|uniref:Uncharacterized protein n=1 Tax=Nepenthes gracilis TaxID=150966 RepID=A0AAD3SQ59_NEPGR|nr:hypothetical protein Nepgr_016357 [Nepenthes gracilis]